MCHLHFAAKIVGPDNIGEGIKRVAKKSVRGITKVRYVAEFRRSQKFNIPVLFQKWIFDKIFIFGINIQGFIIGKHNMMQRLAIVFYTGQYFRHGFAIRLPFVFILSQHQQGIRPVELHG